MKSLKDYIFEATQSVDVKSNVIEMQVPKTKIQELAKILKNEGLGNKSYPINLYVKLHTKNLSDFVCPCELLDASKVYLFRNSSWTYYIEPASIYVPSNNKTDYVKIVNANYYLNTKKVDTDKDCGLKQSMDKTLDFYFVMHHSEGQTLNVAATPEQVALAIIIDLSARTAKMEKK